MNGTLIMFEVAEQRRQDGLCQATHTHFDDHVQVNKPQAQMLSAQQVALTWLGEQLIAWGWRLRARYGAIDHHI